MAEKRKSSNSRSSFDVKLQGRKIKAYQVIDTEFDGMDTFGKLENLSLNFAMVFLGALIGVIPGINLQNSLDIMVLVCSTVLFLFFVSCFVFLFRKNKAYRKKIRGA